MLIYAFKQTRYYFLYLTVFIRKKPQKNQVHSLS